MRGRKKKEKVITQRRKHVKRKRFGTIFLHRWLVVLLVEVLLLSGFVAWQKYECKRAFSSAISQQSMYFYGMSLTQDISEEDMLYRDEYQLAMHAEAYDTFSYLCDMKNMEILAGCEEKMFLMLSDESGAKSRIRSCDTSAIGGWDEYRQKLLEYKKPFQIIHESVEFTTSSQIANSVPTNMRMHVSAIDLAYLLGKSESPKELFEFDLKGVKLPDGYVRENLGYHLAGIVVYGYSPNNPLENKNSEDGYALLKEFYEGVKCGDEEWFADSRVWKEGLFDIQLIDYMQFQRPNGQNVVLLTATSMDVWKNYGGLMMAVGSFAMALGTLVAFVSSKLSYTRLKAAYDMEDYRKNLTNTMAHDLKSPLMSISGYAENLRDNLNTEKQTYYSEAILNSVQYMNGIIESVLYLSKMEEGKISLKRESLHVRELLDRLVTAREEKLQERNLKVDLTGDVVLEADATLFEQLLCNLLDNAIEYASKNTTICVMMKDSQISIQNVCEEDLQTVADTLCQPFVVGDTSRSNRKGSGLGLAIAKNICELHGFEFELICKEKSFEAKIKG